LMFLEQLNKNSSKQENMMPCSQTFSNK